MHRSANRRTIRRTWRLFSPASGRDIEYQLHAGHPPCCPGCGELLEARLETRFSRDLPLDATGYDLDCRDCRRFWCVVRHTPRSLRLLRMRRFAAAVKAIAPESDQAPPVLEEVAGSAAA